MAKFKEHDVVYLNRSYIAEGRLVNPGKHGVIVDVYENDRSYEVEFPLNDGWVLTTVLEDDLYAVGPAADCSLCNDTGKRTFQRLMDVDGDEVVTHVGIITCDCPAGKKLVRDADDAATLQEWAGE